jgi:hypothetical protein
MWANDLEPNVWFSADFGIPPLDDSMAINRLKKNSFCQGSNHVDNCNSTWHDMGIQRLVSFENQSPQTELDPG